MQEEPKQDTAKFQGEDECGHIDWTLGCPRCFNEMSAIANETVAVNVAKGQNEGAILYNWFVVSVLRKLEDGMVPLTRSLDLSEVRVAKDLILNLQELQRYFIITGSDPVKLKLALQTAARMALAAKKLLEEQQGEAEADRPEVSKILLTDAR